MDRENFLISRHIGFKMLGVLLIVVSILILIRGVRITDQLDNHSFNQPLLLASGLATVDQAQVTVIIWLESSSNKSMIQSLLPDAGWQWETTTYSVGQDQALTIAGTRSISRREEDGIRDWYLALAQQIDEAGGRAYFDERITESLDISAYLSAVQAIPQQGIFLNSTISIAAYLPSIYNTVMAGTDPVNIQLLMRTSGDQGKTILAIPALLQEF